MNKEARVIVGIPHLVHMNLYKNAIKILEKMGIDIDIIVRPRGNLIPILKKEYNNPSFISIGKHRPSLHGKMFDTAGRGIQLLLYLRKKDFDVVTGSGDFVLCFAARLLRKPSVLFMDDYEYKLTFDLEKLTSTRVVVPRCIPVTGKNVLKYNGFKQLAYLHPNYFKPDIKALDEYNLKPIEYVFIREVSGSSLNYRDLATGQLNEICKYLKDMGFKIITSLEDKSLRNHFEDECIILNEPVQDIHSLLHFASLTISSGDSMARESCLVGTPSIYTGGRGMIINKELIKRSCMFKVDDKQHLKDIVKNIIENDIKKETEKTIKHAIRHEWDDTTEVIINNLLSVIYKDESLIEKYKNTWRPYNGK